MKEIGFVLFAEVNLLQDLAGEAHALAVGEHTTGDNPAADLGILDFLYFENDKAVVDQNAVAGDQITVQPLAAYRNRVLVADDVPGREGEVVAVRDRKGF